jgi:macrolide transport system ATP-binding/permease protein
VVILAAMIPLASALGSSLLFGVTARDQATYAVSALIVSTAALIASYIPAHRASSVDPMESLRAD